MHALHIQHLSKTYARGKQALDDVSLSVEQGDFFALLGSNGAGKSTLINILADTVRPTSGSIQMMGFDLLAERARAKRLLGVVPQEIAFDPFFTPREVLGFTCGMYGQPEDKAWIDELLERMELAPHAHKVTRQLSGGMKRRLLVAQALVHRPSIVILDEPTAGVDVELRKRLWDFIRELNRDGTTILLTTHYLEEAQELCNQVAIIGEGKVLAAQSMESLLGNVAASALCLHYAQAPVLDNHIQQQLAAFSPRLVGRTVCLDLKHDGTHSDFDAVYQAAYRCFGTPVHAEVRQENLEDVFLRLTHKERLEVKGNINANI